MNFLTDDQELAIIAELDDEPDELDLAASGLGQRILDIAVDEMLTAVRQRRAPDGTPWAPLKPSTVRTKQAKGANILLLGYETGEMTDPYNWTRGSTQIEPRWALWKYQGPEHAKNFHQGNERQAPRPIVGWTYRAEDQARELVRNEVLRMRIDE
jgi:hypothetical protein